MLCFIGAEELKFLIALLRDKNICVCVLYFDFSAGKADAVILIENFETKLSTLNGGCSYQFNLNIKSWLN